MINKLVKQRQRFNFSIPELEVQPSREGGSSSKEDSFEYPDEADDAISDNNNGDNETANASSNAGSKRNNIDQFLVCVFNVSSKVSYSILQVGLHFEREILSSPFK